MHGLPPQEQPAGRAQPSARPALPRPLEAARAAGLRGPRADRASRRAAARMSCRRTHVPAGRLAAGHARAPAVCVHDLFFPRRFAARMGRGCSTPTATRPAAAGFRPPRGGGARRTRPSAHGAETARSLAYGLACERGIVLTLLTDGVALPPVRCRAGGVGRFVLSTGGLSPSGRVLPVPGGRADTHGMLPCRRATARMPRQAVGPARGGTHRRRGSATSCSWWRRSPANSCSASSWPENHQDESQRYPAAPLHRLRRDRSPC